MTTNAVDVDITSNGLNDDRICDIQADTKITKPPRKKSVSFHEDVTDIDAVEPSQIACEDSNLHQGDIVKSEDLSDIFNVSEKISFFKNAFNGETKDSVQQTTIPQARLAFVTGMVHGSSAGRDSRVDQGREEATVTRVGAGEDERPQEKCYVEVPPVAEAIKSPQDEKMATTTLTYSKIFAQPKKNMGGDRKSNEAVVDTTSILEHREELRELWEKRMMADDNQSSSPSIVAEAKPQQEEAIEEKVPKGESESNGSPKIPNGVANHVDTNIPDTNANHIQECNGNVVKESTVNALDADQENNNSADSLEEDNVEHSEEKTYSSNLEQALITKDVRQISSETTVVTSSTVAEEVSEVKTTVLTEAQESEEAHHVENAVETSQVNQLQNPSEKIVAEDTGTPENEASTDSAQEPSQKNVAATEQTIIKDYQEKLESLSEKMVILDVKTVEDDEDGFVPVEECLPKDDNPDEEVDLPTENFEPSNEEPEIAPSANGFGENLLLSPTDLSPSIEKVSHPEMEQFVKSGGVKRIIPGVQKTEQPYNTCTTETKIAMEIREMREREEELRIMREQALLSPVASPVPPKTPSLQNSTPSPKEGPSPVPQGPGYRVSSVFGHRGTLSPSLPTHEEKKSFGKESAVEKEIRLAKDREEELRKQKGLPPREDDSYVKPSEVKSSQVRVFGKAMGASSVRQAATAKIQMEIEEQTQREMALRETGHIQTISQERTDAKVAKLKPAESPVHTNGNSAPSLNGNHTNESSGHSSPDYSVPYKRSSPSPTNARPASIFAPNTKGNISMHKFISSKGKEATFNTPRNGPFVPKDETRPVVPPAMVKLKRNVSVESKIQQEIMEMKQREEELRKMHLNTSNGNEETHENGLEDEMNQKNNFGNGNIPDEEISPRHNKLIAQWEQRIQKAES